MTAPADITLEATGALTLVTLGTASATSPVDGSITPSASETGPFAVGSHLVTWTATDSAGNVGTATQTVTITDTTAPTVTVPSDITVNSDAGLPTRVVTYSVSANDIVGGPLTPTLTGGLASGSAFAVGTTTVTYTATDAAGNTGTASFTVTVNDSEPPVILGIPADINLDVDYPSTGAVATFTDPTVSDNAPGATITQTAGPASGSTFPLGTTTVTYTATDVAGNVVTASFTVTVNQIAPGNVTLEVVTDGTDGTFNFASSEPQFAFPVTSSSGSGTSPTVTIKPGTYLITVTPPSGFSLASVTCTDTDSVGSVSGQSATINLASGENVTCTFSALNSRTKTVEVISQFMQRRADLLLSNGPDGNRQIDRLLQAGRQSGGSGGDGAGADFSSGGGMAKGGTNTGRATSLGLAAGAGPMSPGGMGSSSAFAQFVGMETARGRFADQMPIEQQMAMLGGEPSAGISSNGADASTGLSPLLVNGTYEGSLQLSFSTSLSQMMKYGVDRENRRLKDALGAIEVEGVPQTTLRFSPLDIWLEGHYADFSDDRNPGGDSDGHFGVVYLGADYVLSPSILIGALVQYDSMNQSSRTAAFDIEGKGWMAGPYATVRLADNLFYQGRAAWGRSDNDVSPFLTYTDSFSSERWLVTSALIGNWNVNGFNIRPSAEIDYIEDHSDAYADSLGVNIPGLTVSLGQLRTGPEISRRFEVDGGAFEPRLGLEAIWNFESSNDVTDFGGTLAGPEELRGRVELGIKAQTVDGLTLDISGSFDGIGSDDYTALTGRAMLRVPLN